MRAVSLCLVLAAAFAARISYDGQQILRCSFKEPSSIAALEEVIDVQGVFPGEESHLIDVRVQTPSDLEYIQKFTTGCEVKIADLEAETQRFEALNLEARERANADWFDAYHTYAEIQSWYQALAPANPGLVTWVPQVGLSFQNRTIFGVRIFDRNTSTTRNPTRRIFFTGQIHAREWISGATVQYIVNQTLAAWKSNDTLIRNFLTTTELIVLPLVNPDGYVYTWTNDRQWRKNRRTNSGSTCVGVDQNRNYNDHWGQGGSSTSPCSDTYMGSAAASESEVKAVQNYFLEVQKGVPIVGAIDWHSYSQLVLRPYGWTSATSPDDAILKQLGDKYAADIKAQSGKTYTSQTSYALYITTGSASDWYYGTQAFTGNGGYRVASYTIELRPTGTPGFELPPAEIVPTGRENWAAIRNWFDYLNRSPIYRP